MCVACGTPPLAGNKFCPNCKAETAPNAAICMKCGVSLKTTGRVDGREVGNKDWLTTLLLCIFLGLAGIHSFYCKKTVIGVVQLLTLGGCGIWTLIDFIMILTGSFRDGDGKTLVKK
jgi:hypothetical protein